ncbi:hypothetical protein AB6G58_08055 [Providencia huaxiensis]
MRLITYRSDVTAAARLGAIVDQQVVDLARLAEEQGQYLPDNMLDFIDLGLKAYAWVLSCLISTKGYFLRVRHGQCKM